MTLTLQDILRALTRVQSDILSINPTKKCIWAPGIERLFVHGTAFGAGHLGVETWRDPNCGFSIRDEVVREACAALLQARAERPLNTLVVLDESLCRFTQADLGLDALRGDRSALLQSNGLLLVPAEVFISRYYRTPLPRLRNPTPARS
jgi:hypothetical protein